MAVVLTTDVQICTCYARILVVWLVIRLRRDIIPKLRAHITISSYVAAYTCVTGFHLCLGQRLYLNHHIFKGVNRISQVGAGRVKDAIATIQQNCLHLPTSDFHPKWIGQSQIYPLAPYSTPTKLSKHCACTEPWLTFIVHPTLSGLCTHSLWDTAPTYLARDLPPNASIIGKQTKLSSVGSPMSLHPCPHASLQL